MNYIRLRFWQSVELWSVLLDGSKIIACYGKTVRGKSVIPCKQLNWPSFLCCSKDIKQALRDFGGKLFGVPTAFAWNI
jgi:hypothetical protein